MISVYSQLWQRLQDYGLKYQTGQDNVDQFNTRLAETQIEVYNLFSDYYQANEKIRSLFEPWRKKISGNTTTNSITIDNTKGVFDRIVAMAVTAPSQPSNILFEINPIMEGELVFASRIPQRKPDYANKRVYYLMESQATVASPETPAAITLVPTTSSIDYVVYYLVYPYEAKIAFTLSETDDEDIITYDDANSVDLAWDQSANNLILYKLLEKYGVKVREGLLQEYSKLGLRDLMSEGQAA